MAQDSPDGQWRALPERVRTVWLINEAIGCAVWLAACGVFAAVCIANDWWGFWTQLVAAIVAVYSIGDLATQPLQTKYLYAFTRFQSASAPSRRAKGGCSAGPPPRRTRACSMWTRSRIRCNGGSD